MQQEELFLKLTAHIRATISELESQGYEKQKLEKMRFDQLKVLTAVAELEPVRLQLTRIFYPGGVKHPQQSSWPSLISIIEELLVEAKTIEDFYVS